MNSRGRSAMLWFPAFFLALVFIAPASTAAQTALDQGIEPYHFTRFDRLTPAEGLSFPMVQAAYQDSQGYMWFATAGGGLNRYDGYNFTVYRHDAGDPESLPFDDVRCLLEDSNGEFWIGGSGGLARFEPESETFTHVDSRGQVFAVIEDRDGVIWAAFWHGLYAYDQDTGALVQSYQHNPDLAGDSGQISEGYVHALYEDRAGALWVGTEGGLDRLDRKTGIFTHYRRDPDDPGSLSHNAVLSIFEDGQERLWIGTAAGLNLLYRSSGSFTRFQHDPDDPESLGFDAVNDILEDDQGALWLATYHGLDRLTLSGDEARFSHYRHNPLNPYSLSDDVVNSLYQDRSGVLWVATANGLSKVNRRAGQFARYQQIGEGLETAAPDEFSALSDDIVLTFFEDRDGLIWIGGNNGGLYRLDPRLGSLRAYRHNPSDPDSLSFNRVQAIFEDAAGELWLGTGDGGLSRFDRDTERFIHERQLPGTSITQITEDGQGTLWLGTSGNGLFSLDADRVTLAHYKHFWRQGNHWKLYGSLSSHIVESLYLDQQGQLWIGTYAGGINLWDGLRNRFDHYRHDSADPLSLGSDRVLSFSDDPDAPEQIFWVGTMGGGLNRFDRATETFTRFTAADGLPGDAVNCILPDAAGYLWLVTVQGLARFDPDSETFLNFDQHDGVPGIATSCYRSSSGTFYFGTTNGFYTIQPEQMPVNNQAPPIVITDFRVHNLPVSADLLNGEEIQLAYQDNVISFEFAALDFTAPEKNEYAYMLVGQDETWVYAGDRRHVEYTNLPPGEYIFQVKGANNDGLWNEEGAAISLSISPPFWQTWWFRGIFLLGLVVAVYGGYRLRVHTLEARGRQLEEEVEARTAELLAINELLEKEIEERARAEDELAKQRAAAAVTAERGRLARELHDAVTQTLFSASLIAEIVPQLWARNPEAGRRQLEEVRTLTRGALAEMRTLLLELRPEAITRSNMEELLGQLGRATTGRCGAPVTVNAEEEDPLPPEIKLAFYRIAQEALNNVAKHAEAGQIMVDFSSMSSRARLVVADDGLGFNVAAIPPDHFGLQIMQERAGAIGATLGITSRPGEGTRIIVQWPESSPIKAPEMPGDKVNSE